MKVPKEPTTKYFKFNGLAPDLVYGHQLRLD